MYSLVSIAGILAGTALLQLAFQLFDSRRRITERVLLNSQALVDRVRHRTGDDGGCREQDKRKVCWPRTCSLISRSHFVSFTSPRRTDRQTPACITDSRRHCRSGAQSSARAFSRGRQHQIVIGDPDSDSRFQVFELFAERPSQPARSFGELASRAIEPLDVACA
jgi:hypothetical protein